MIREKELAVTAVGAVTVHGGAEKLLSAYHDKTPITNTTCDISNLEKYVSKKITRRMCRLTSMALLAVYECLADETNINAPLSAKSGIILATGYGPADASFKYLDSIIDYGFEMPSPLYFSTSVQNIPAASIALTLGLSIPVQTLCQYEYSVHAALKTAHMWLSAGIAEDILLIGVDEYVPTLGVCADIISGTYKRHSRNIMNLTEGALCMRIGNNAAKKYGRIIFSDDERNKIIKSFRSGAYRAEIEGMQDNSAIYGNTPVAHGLDILIALGVLGKYPEAVKCFSADSWGNVGSVLVSR